MEQKKEYDPLTLEDNMPFGKHKGALIQDLIKKEADYLKWLIDNTDISFGQDVHDALN